MLHSGLVSITFRKLSPREIVQIVREAELDGIEWGGDVHVPPGNLQRAREVGAMTRSAGLAVAAYGSYCRVGDPSPCPFESVVETARLLGAPVIRVWAGSRRPPDADPLYWEQAVADAQRFARLAARVGIQLAFEFHGGTLTETGDSAERLLQKANQGFSPAVIKPSALTGQSRAPQGIGGYWQPPVGADYDTQQDGLARLLPWLVHVHVNNVTPSGYSSLAERADEWASHIATIRSTGRDHYLMVEFVKGEAPESFFEDAGVLRQLLAAPPA